MPLLARMYGDVQVLLLLQADHYSIVEWKKGRPRAALDQGLNIEEVLSRSEDQVEFQARSLPTPLKSPHPSKTFGSQV